MFPVNKRNAKHAIFAAIAIVAVFAGGVALGQATQRFSDVSPDDYFHDAAIWADAAGITTGCGDGTKFCPDDTLTRAHMITFLKRYEDWVQDGRRLPGTEGAGAGLACLTHEQGCDITLESLQIPQHTVLFVGVDIAPGNWRLNDNADNITNDCDYAVLNRDAQTHPSYMSNSEVWPNWYEDLKSVPGHGYDFFSDTTSSFTRNGSKVISLSVNDYAFIFGSTYNGEVQLDRQYCS